LGNFYSSREYAGICDLGLEMETIWVTMRRYGMGKNRRQEAGRQEAKVMSDE
jgi:hypothetical protein